MIAYQVDECLNSKKLVASCAAEGLAKVRRFPFRLKQSEDPVVLQEVLPTGWTLVTTDREIHLLHSAYIPNRHSGILIIASCESSRTICIRDVMGILRKFKTAFPEWHVASLHNSVVELTEQQAEVWQVVNGVAKRAGLFEFKNPNWQDGLRDLLTKLAQT